MSGFEKLGIPTFSGSLKVYEGHTGIYRGR